MASVAERVAMERVRYPQGTQGNIRQLMLRRFFFDSMALLLLGVYTYIFTYEKDYYARKR